MSLHINRFGDRVKAADARGQKDFTMSLGDAKDLHADITKLLLALHLLQEEPAEIEPVKVEVDGGSF